MAEEKEKAIEKDQETIIPGTEKDDLSEKDLEKTAGGGRCSDTWYKIDWEG
jgi:hypothetical protein